jgi:RNA polymerase sigma-70 factor (ECF subfamily)
MPDFPDDKDLVFQFKNGSQKDWVFTQIIQKYQEKLYALIRRIIISHDDTNDVLQNVFIKVWNNLNSFREDSQLFTWLYKIATNESLNFIEKRKKNRYYSLIDDENDLINKIKADETFDVNKIEWKLQLAIQKLPEKQKIVFNLRYYEEMPYDEMSEILETSAGALKASYHFAVKKIEAYLTSQ